jgi:putative transposase
MHLTLKEEATKPAALNFLQQQAQFDEFIDTSTMNNNERPHEALDVKCPAEVYQPSTLTYRGLPYRRFLSRQDDCCHQLRSDLSRSQKD